MTSPGTLLVVVVDQRALRFQERRGDRLDLSRLSSKKRDAVQYLLSHSFPLSETLQKRITGHIKYHESTLGWWKMCCFGICLPSGMLLSNTWDYDRDTDALKTEVLEALAGVLQPTDYELAEHVQSEELFSKGGKPLFRLYLS